MPDHPTPPDQVTDRDGTVYRRFAIVMFADGTYWTHDGSLASFADALEMRAELLDQTDEPDGFRAFVVPSVAASDILHATSFRPFERNWGSYVKNGTFDHFCWIEGKVVVGEHTLGVLD